MRFDRELAELGPNVCLSTLLHKIYNTLHSNSAIFTATARIATAPRASELINIIAIAWGDWPSGAETWAARGARKHWVGISSSASEPGCKNLLQI
jgi:hypothetical protein